MTRVIGLTLSFGWLASLGLAEAAVPLEPKPCERHALEVEDLGSLGRFTPAGKENVKPVFAYELSSPLLSKGSLASFNAQADWLIMKDSTVLAVALPEHTGSRSDTYLDKICGVRGPAPESVRTTDRLPTLDGYVAVASQRLSEQRTVLYVSRSQPRTLIASIPDESPSSIVRLGEVAFRASIIAVIPSIDAPIWTVDALGESEKQNAVVWQRVRWFKPAAKR